MELDQLLTLLSVVCSKVLPIVGVVVLVLVAIFVRHLIIVMKSTNEAVIILTKTMNTANQELASLEKPLQTLQDLSETVDTVHEASKHAVRSALVTIIQNFSSIKEWAFARNQDDSNDDEQTDCSVKEEGEA